jgi:hypothetical protein
MVRARRYKIPPSPLSGERALPEQAFGVPVLPQAETAAGVVMALERIKKRLTRTEVADQLAQLVQELRDGRISLGRNARRLPASDELEFSANFEEDRLKVELKWDT